MGGESRRRKERELQVANVVMTFKERAMLRGLVGSAPAKTLEEAAKAGRALESLDGEDDPFMPPRFQDDPDVGSAQEQRAKWNAAFSARMETDDEEPVLLTIESAGYVMTAISRRMEVGQVDNNSAHMLRRALRRIKALSEGTEVDGVEVVRPAAAVHEAVHEAAE